MSYKHTATSDVVYSQLKERILHLELPPGAAISEIETTAAYHISRTPVRDAFKRLEQEGLLEIRPHIGTFISLIDLNAVSDVLYIREVLEFSVFSDLTRNEHFSDKNIRPILEYQKKLLETDLPIQELSRSFILSDNAFHTALFESAGRKHIIEFLYGYNSQYERFRTFINFNGKEDIRKLYENHVQILECIMDKDLDKLKDYIHHHLYDGFRLNREIASRYPEYFTQILNKKEAIL